MSRRKIMRDIKIRAHFCFVTRLINHSWKVESRLVIHQLSRDGSRRAGNVIEVRISGIPRRDGLENWSKKLKFMVCAEPHWGLCFLIGKGLCLLR
uniref:Uncharacterized protein n=1 Tax=Zonotrichia albicollis TaxID=44394 RepID=A0A8D2NDK7_ZONAL